MSNYTIRVQRIVEMYNHVNTSYQFAEIDDAIKQALPQIFNFDFPIFSENYRENLELKIIRHYYMREIAFETVALWKLYLNQTLNEIMPYYNVLYEQEIDKIFPNTDFESTKTIESNENGSNNGNNATESKNTEKFSDTPQGSLDRIESGRYLTTATITDNSSTQQTTSNHDIETNTTEKNSGRNSNIIDIAEKYRQNLVNIDMRVIDELEPLFFGLWM